MRDTTAEVDLIIKVDKRLILRLSKLFKLRKSFLFFFFFFFGKFTGPIYTLEEWIHNPSMPSGLLP